MPRFKTGLRIAMAVAFAIPLLLGFVSFCTFTFSSGGTGIDFHLSPLEMITGKTVDFSSQVLGRSPLLGALFFLIPVIGLIGCLIPKADVRAAIAAISSLGGAVYLFLTGYLIPDSVFYDKPLQQVFTAHLSPDQVTYGMTLAGNAMWVFYLLALISAAVTFIVFLRDMKSAMNDTADMAYDDGAIRLEDEEETYFDEIDEIEPPLYEEEDGVYPMEDTYEYDEYDGNVWEGGEPFYETPPEEEDVSCEEPQTTVQESCETATDATAADTVAEDEPEPPIGQDAAVFTLPAQEEWIDKESVPEDAGAADIPPANEPEPSPLPDTEEQAQEDDAVETQPLSAAADNAFPEPSATDIAFKKLNFNHKNEKKKVAELPKLSFTKKESAVLLEQAAGPETQEAYFTDAAKDASFPENKNICPKCGAPVRSNTTFCKKCGARIK